MIDKQAGVFFDEFLFVYKTSFNSLNFEGDFRFSEVPFFNIICVPAGYNDPLESFVELKLSISDQNNIILSSND